MSDGRSSEFAVSKFSARHGSAAAAETAAAPAAATRLSSFNAASAVTLHEPAW